MFVIDMYMIDIYHATLACYAWQMLSCMLLACADCRVYAACKVASLLLKASGRRRVSGAEAFDRVCITVSVSNKMLSIKMLSFDSIVLALQTFE